MLGGRGIMVRFVCLISFGEIEAKANGDAVGATVRTEER